MGYWVGTVQLTQVGNRETNRFSVDPFENKVPLRHCRDMKAKIHITPKKAVLDPQGKAVQNALAQLGHGNITAVHVGKYLELELAPDAEREATLVSLHEACRRFLTNPVIEDYQLSVE